MKKIFLVQLFVMLCFIFSCKEMYTPDLNSLPKSFLVVEGVLNAGTQPTTIHLTRTFKLEQKATVKTENNAKLTVEGNNNSITVLTGTGNGNYISSGNLNLNVGNEYRLRIKTSDGKEYLSDYVKVKITPPIDSINWKREDKGVRIYANTKDPSNATKYYRWDYDETWEIRSHYFADIIYENGVIRKRVFPGEDVSVCWKYNSSTNILISNSTRLQTDIISEAPLLFIPVGDEKLYQRYSILVRQYALEEGAYNFFELMKKNSEQIGSLFSPQPSELRGNLHCVTNPDEFVIGFVTASSITEKRIFITISEVSPWPIFNLCEYLSVANIRDSIEYWIGAGLRPYNHITPPPDDRYLFSTPECIDCTIRGGSIIRPLFW